MVSSRLKPERERSMPGEEKIPRNPIQSGYGQANDGNPTNEPIRGQELPQSFSMLSRLGIAFR
jgi:hypothetical protein